MSLIAGDDQRWGELVVGVGGAVMVHIGIVVLSIALTILQDLAALLRENRSDVRAYFDATYDIDLAPKPAPPPPIVSPPDPAPPPPEAPKVAANKPKEEDPYDQPAAPPKPAEAAKVLTKNDDPDDRLDFSNTIVSGNGSATYGFQAKDGKGDKPVVNPAAKIDGVVGGTGTGTAPPAPPPPDKSTAAGLEGGTNWSNCPFPPEADSEQIDSAVVTLVVTVRPDGSALSATVTADPGHGFARAARMCALARRYIPGRDRDGTPTTKTTPPITVRFSR